MEEDIKHLLERNLEISKKSLEVLQKLYKAQKWRTVFSIIKWALIIGLIVFGFLQIQPYLSQLTELWGKISNGFENINRIFPGH